MPFYTSYLWRGVELNDGVSYLVALRDADFDSQNEASPSYAERQYATPMLLGATLQSGSVPLTVQIKATSKADFDTKMSQLQRLFSTAATTAYQFQRKMAHEAAYRYLTCTVTSVVANRLERTVKIMLSTEDRRWKDTNISEWTTQLFETVPVETHQITNAGYDEVEPIITLTALSVPATTNQPRFWRDVTVYVTESRQFDSLPLLISQGWDTSGLVSLDKIRPDGLDISVMFKGTIKSLPRIVSGTVTDRRVWVQLAGFPTILRTHLTDFLTTAVQTTLTLGSGIGQSFRVPGYGKVAIDDEIVEYTAWRYLDEAQQVVLLTGCTRGRDGTTAVAHQTFTRVKFPLNFTVYYGYGAGYEVALANNFNGWQRINYATSNNNEWVFERPIDPLNVNAPASSPYSIGFQPNPPRPPRTAEYVAAGIDGGGTQDERNNTRAALFGAYGAGGTLKGLTRLVMNIKDAARKPEQVRFKVLLKGSAFSVIGNAKVGFKIVRAGFNIPGQEVATTLTTREHAGTTPTSYDTGYLNTEYYQRGGSHLMWDSVISSQPPVNVVYENFLVLEAVHLKLDTSFGAAPTIAYPSLPIEQGLTTGTFLFHTKIINLTTGDMLFEVTAADFQASQILTIDADARTVTGGNLSYVSYTNPTWLRLVAGVNSIQFSTHMGSGAVNVALTWRNRY